MDSEDLIGTTVTVGSVSELANILANMPPEQLQNVQLDPILYNALFQTIDTNTQVLDGNNQVIHYETHDMDRSVQTLASDVELHDSTIQQIEHLQKVDADCHIQKQNENTITNPDLKPKIKENVSTDFKFNVISTISNEIKSLPEISTEVLSLPIGTYDTGISRLSQLSTSSTSLVNQCNKGISQQNQLCNPQGESNNQTPQREKNIALINQVSIQGAKSSQLNLGSNTLQLGLPCILPGQCSSLIVTPTVMSQVKPTAVVQSMKVNNVNASPYLQGIIPTLNSHLPANIPTNPFQIDDGHIIQVPICSITGDQITSVSQQVNYRKSTHQEINTNYQGNKDKLVLDKNVYGAHTLASNDIPTQVLSSDIINVNPINLANILPEKTTILSNSNVSSKLYYSIPITTLIQDGGILEYNESLPKENNCGSSSTIVLTSKQLSNLMGGKSTEHLFHGTGLNDGLALSTEVSVHTDSTELNKVKIAKSKSEIQLVSVKPTEMEEVQPGVFKMKFTTVKDNSNEIKGTVNHTLFANAIKPRLPVSKSSTSLTVVKTQGASRDIVSDDRKLQPIKPPTPSNLADIRKNLLKSMSPFKSNKTKVATSSFSTSTILHAPKAITDNIQSNISTSASMQHTNTNVLHSGNKYMESQQGNVIALSRALPNQNISHTNKRISKSFDDTTHGKLGIFKKGVNNCKGSIKKLQSTNNISEIKSKCNSNCELVSYSINSNQTKMASPVNIVKSVLQNAIKQSDPDKSETKHLTNIDCENKERKYDILGENKKKGNFINSGKVMFSRSFKKNIHGTADSKLKIKKTLKEIEKTYPKEVSEILHIREAIKSSHVGEGEIAMRQLAKLEIENQLKRFSQKVNMIKTSSESTFSDVLERKFDHFNLSQRKKKLEDHNALNLELGSHSRLHRPIHISKTEIFNQDDINKREGKDGPNRKNEVIRVANNIKEQARKRERPKKFDDFVLNSKPKKDKKSKTRKFFFPEDFDKYSQKDANEELMMKEEIFSSIKPNKINENTEDMTVTEDELSRSNDVLMIKNEQPDVNYQPQKKYEMKERKELSISSENKESNVSSMSSKNKERILSSIPSGMKENNVYSIPRENVYLNEIVDEKSANISGETAVGNKETALTLKQHFVGFSSEKKENQLPMNYHQGVAINKELLSEKGTDQIIAANIFEERSFLDAISGHTVTIVENEVKDIHLTTTAQREVKDINLENVPGEIGKTILEENLSSKTNTTNFPEPQICVQTENYVVPVVSDSSLNSKEKLENVDVIGGQIITSKTKNNKVSKKKKRKKSSLLFEPAVLPQHLKNKPKCIKFEEAVIDLTKVQLKSAFTESSFILSDTIQFETHNLLQKNTWVCTLCDKPGNLGNLDVLFGPYKVNINSNNDGEKNNVSSVWIHRDCAIWTSTIYIANQTLCGLGDTLNSAAKMRCSVCSQVGATLECSFRKCRDGYHFVCAKQRGCSFKIENFTITCPKHR